VPLDQRPVLLIDEIDKADIEFPNDLLLELDRMEFYVYETQETVKVDLVPEGLRINVFDRSHKPIFEPDSDVFTGYGSWVFSTLAWEISRYQTFKIELEGHTESNTQTGREVYSKWELSSERANAARRKLVQSGVTPLQIFKVSGFADTQPMPDQPPTDEGNRRVTVLLKVQNPQLHPAPNYAQHP